MNLRVEICRAASLSASSGVVVGYPSISDGGTPSINSKLVLVSVGLLANAAIMTPAPRHLILDFDKCNVWI
jgi:hypothetical protein